MDRIAEVKRLCHQVKSDFDDCLTKLLQEARERADQAVDDGMHLKSDQDKFNTLKDQIEGLKSRLAQQTVEMRVVSEEDEELSHRLKLVQTEILNEESAHGKKKETLKNLMMEVVEMEHEKDNRVDKMKKDFDSTMKMWKIYKAYLDIRIVLNKPDKYSIGFSASKDTPTALTLRSFPDLDHFEVMEAGGTPEFAEELTSYLIETKDLLGVMCRARHRLQ